MTPLKTAIYGILISTIIVITGCSSSSSDSNDNDNDDSISAITYSTTSTRGDYSEWSISGNDLSAEWQVVNESGQIDFIYTIEATCGTSDEFGIKVCSISTASCTNGVAVCGDMPSGSLEMMDIPGLALFVNSEDAGVDKQLHVGFAKNANACSDNVSGDYTFIRTGLGLNENFGMYRSDSDFVNIMHSDFGFDTADGNVTQSVAYRTGTESETLTDGGCVDGVRFRTAGGSDLRSMMTESGLFVLDLPAGQGGLISFKINQAASLSDFAGKTLGGISFPDNDDPSPILATLGTVSADKIEITLGVAGSTSTLHLMDLGTADSLTNPSYPDFTVTPGGYDSAALSADYPNPDSIPGLFKIEDPTDSGRVILAGMKFNGKVIGIGMVYNERNTSDIDPSAGDGVTTFDADGLYNTGNFIIFEM